MVINDRKIERVARAICEQAGMEISPSCAMCEDGVCKLWPSFRKEAVAAIKAMKGF